MVEHNQLGYWIPWAAVVPPLTSTEGSGLDSYCRGDQ